MLNSFEKQSSDVEQVSESDCTRLRREITEVSFCPYCESEDIEWMGDAFGDDDDETPFYCHQCDSWFGLLDFSR